MQKRMSFALGLTTSPGWLAACSKKAVELRFDLRYGKSIFGRGVEFWKQYVTVRPKILQKESSVF